MQENLTVHSQSYPRTTVTVITISRRRVSLLERAILSVRRQDLDGVRLCHLILVDDCEETADWLSKNVPDDGSVIWRLTGREFQESSGPARLAKLRNLACKLASPGWIAFLDDDNEFERHHIRTLLATAAATGCPAVHSFRKLYHFDGRPFLEDFWPWCRWENEARERYLEYVAKGIVVPGSNIVREHVVVAADGHTQYLHIDMNVWLLRRDVLLAHPMADRFSKEDWIANLTEDDKLLEALIKARVPIETSGVPSVRYYLGGYSNDFQRKHMHSEVWAPPGEQALRSDDGLPPGTPDTRSA